VISNLERYKKDLDALVDKGSMLENALNYELRPDEFTEEVKKQFGSEADEFLKTVPSFARTYQHWYSEAKALVRQLLPDRLSDFVRHYEKPKPRKLLDFESYRIEDCLQGVRVVRGYQKEVVVDGSAALPHFRQQLAIVKSIRERFESSLFDIRLLVQGDLFDSELDAARELAKNKFLRAAGAVAGVVLEKHLGQVCENHTLKSTKKNPTIADFNDLLKESGVIDVPQWRSIQYLGDLRNLCDHDKKVEPTVDQVNDLITGVSKLTKNLF
jgi:hypothetical protein